MKIHIPAGRFFATTANDRTPFSLHIPEPTKISDPLFSGISINSYPSPFYTDSGSILLASSKFIGYLDTLNVIYKRMYSIQPINTINLVKITARIQVREDFEPCLGKESCIHKPTPRNHTPSIRAQAEPKCGKIPYLGSDPSIQISLTLNPLVILL